MHDYRAEFGEDKWMVENLPLPSKGVYVDVGCNHPVEYSNTAFLRSMGWTGVGIDANGNFAGNWDGVTGAKFVCAVVSNLLSVPFAPNHSNPAQSRVMVGAETVEARTLDGILDESGVTDIDLLSLDIEGHEFEALCSLSLHRFAPRVIISEYNTAGIGEDFRVKEYLEMNGYAAVHRTLANFVYVRRVP